MARERWASIAIMVAGALFVAGFSGPDASAESEEYAFGQGLLKRRWYDMAEKVFRSLSKTGATKELRNKGELGLINVLKTRAENEQKPDVKKELFDEAISKYKKFLEGRSDPQALFNLAELLKSKGVDFTRQIKLAEDEEMKKGLVKEAHTAFKEAVQLIKDFLDKIKEKMKSKQIDLEELPEEERDQLRNAMFSHADLHYLMAQVFEGSREKKIDILRKAVMLFEEFIWDFEDYGQAYLAYVQTGRCYVEMGEYGAALDQYNNVFLVPLQKDERGRIIATAAQRKMRDSLRAMAYFRTLEALVLAKKFKEALAKAAEMEREYPKIIEDSFADPFSGRAATLEKAKAMAGLGRISDAISEAVRVVDKGGWYMQVGMKLLGDWVAKDPKASVRIVLLQAEGLFRTRKLKRAIGAYQNAIDKIDTKDKLREFGCQAWMDMADVYAAREMYYEAALSFQEGERVAQAFVEKMGRNTLRDEKLKALWDRGAECAYKAYRAFKLGWEVTRKGRTGSEHMKSLYSEQRKELTKRYADSVYAKNLQFFAGQDQLRQGKYLDAVLSFQNVDKISDFYETSLVGIGQAYFKEYDRKRQEVEKKAKEAPGGAQGKVSLPASVLGYLEKARESLEEFIRITETRKVEGEEAEVRRRTLFGYTNFFLARVYSEKEDWKKVLEVLEGFEDTYKEKPDLVLTAVFLKLRAYYRQKRARAVEDMLRIMEEVDEVLRDREKRIKRHMYLIMGYQYAGAIYGEMAADAKKKREREAYQEYTEKAAEYLWIWIKNDILVDLETTDPTQVVGRLDAVGIKMFKAKEFSKAALLYETILMKLGDQLNEAQKLRYNRKLGDCYIAQAEAEMSSAGKKKITPERIKEIISLWEKALDIFKAVYEAKKLEMFLGNLVKIYTNLGDLFLQLGDAQKANLNYDEALKLYNVVLTKDKPESKQWWEWKLAVWGILFKKGEYKSIVKQITNAELLYPTMGSKKLKKKILELQDKAKELAGSRSRRRDK